MPEKTTPLQFVNALNDFGTTTYWTGQNVATWLEQLKLYQTDPSQFPEGTTTVNSIKYPLAQTDLYGTFFKNGFEQLHNFSFSGGSEKTNYRSSFAYTNQDGIIVSNNDAYKKYNFSSFLNTELTKKLTAGINIFYNNDAKKTPANYGQLFYNVITFGSYAPTGEGSLPGSTEILPYSSPNNIAGIESPFQETSNNLRMFGKLEYRILKNLKVTGEYTFTQANYAGVQVRTVNRYVNPLSFQLDIPYATSSYNKYTSATNNNALNLYASYSLNLANAHSFALLAGTNQELNKQSGYGANRLNLITPTVPSFSTSTGTTSATDDFNEYAVSGYFYRVNYGYRNKYLIEITGRYDGSSRFPVGHRFGFFPAVSAGWTITEEPFMNEVKNIFSLLKLRGSYGTIGNQVTYKQGTSTQDYYPATPGMNPQNASWIDPSTNIVFTTLAAPLLVSNNFTWERIRTTNIGLDWAALNNRLTGSFDVYKEETLDMLGTGSSLPAIIGAAPPKQNRADLRVNGWDMHALWSDKANDKLSYSIGFNLSVRQPAIITKYNNPSMLLSDYYEGQRLNEIWGFVTQGYFVTSDFATGALNDKLINNGSVKQNNGLTPGIAGYRGVLQSPGDIRFADLNGDSVIFTGQNTVLDPGDRKIIGNSTRRLQYGVNGNVAYGNFDMSFFIQGIGKRDVWISNQVFFPYQNQFAAIYAHQLDYWTPTNTNAYFPRSYANASGPTGTSQSIQTKYLSNGAYLRVKSLAAGFTVPSAWINSLHIEKARIFFSGENLFTFDHLPDGLDPESSNLGSGGIYPFLKKYSFGININF